MVFSSILFLFRFLPAVLLLYFIAPKKFRNLCLFISSLVFYCWGEVRYFPILIYGTLLDYFVSLGIEKNRGNRFRCKLLLTLSIAGNLGILIFFKYTNFFIENINMLFDSAIPRLSLTLPLGISFYTFQTMGYSIDVYRGNVKAERNIIDFGAFVTLFPQLIAGPIVLYSDIAKELKKRTINLKQIEDGIFLFVMGLGSKVLIANNIGQLWDQVAETGFNNVSSILAWLGISAFALQIYFDFSGYSLMAIGLGKILGFNFPQNFNFPYISKSVTEFWRRWHMTLSSWFRDYVYIPLGGNRRGVPRQLLNLLAVWFLTGFWHGASWNFIFWGLYFYVLLMAEKLFLLKHLNKGRVLPRIYLIFAALVSWSIFAVTDINELGAFISKLFSLDGGSDWIYYLRNYAVVMALGIFFSTPLIKILHERVKHIKAVNLVLVSAVLLVSVAYLVDSTYNPFLYFRF